ncbi:putative disease resistance protein RGA1 [Arachis stenosperma]|uniref:putative disease resistance protein RGA1 n=1 Tax=Arachis stenosperma TaxID=217475 RepID=UPI0025ACB67F|nr:putative disease resistance protein RGA1 [Arachis stenosperma]
MAEALLGIVLENLIPFVQSEFAAFFGIKEKAEELSRTLELIKAVLDDAEQKQWSNRPLKVWLQQLKDAMYVLDDILDQLPTESSRLGCLTSLNPKKVIHRRELGQKLNEIIGRLDRIAQARSNFDLRQGVRERPSEVVEWRQTSSTIAVPQVYGRDEDKGRVVEFLLSPSRSSEFLSVYPIVGFGGLGKTTLVQLVYNDPEVGNNFDLKIWVCVSENFTMESILRSILEAITNEKYELKVLDVMEKKVKELLQSKKYLMVLDDVWKRSQEMELGLTQAKWDKLRSVLSCGSKGSSILVSTRDNHVATIMGTCQAHHLGGLSEEDCWLLFKLHAFGAEKEERAELVAIGKEIVKKCGGSPLAALALGGVMQSRSTEKEWVEVQKSELWSLPEENDIMRVLRLSYSCLTPTLKQCFAFCAIFPKDTEIMKQELIYLWIANGFISSRRNLEVEDVGNMVWNELYQKSFFQDVTSDDFSCQTYFKMHDLVHDLAQSISEQECICLEKQDLNDSSRNPHHIVFHGIGKKQFLKRSVEKAESLRTLYQLDSYGFPFSSRLIQTNNSLRVLCIYGRKIPSFGSLSCLRYLELRALDIKSLPASICNLRRLEILKLIQLNNLSHLPKHLTRMQNLRHLVIENCVSLTGMFPDAHKLCDLRTLSIYIVKSEKGHSLAEIRHLNLGGKLRISGLGNVGSISEAKNANLKGKQDLRELILSWSNSGKSKSVLGAEEVLEALQPHSTLKLLTIHEYEGLHWPTWMGNNSATHNLVSLRLDYGMCGHLPPVGKLPFLKKLLVRRMYDVQYIEEDESYDGVEAMPFPSLEKLELYYLPNVERLLKRETTHMFPSLSKLYIYECPKLQLPCLPHVKDLSVWGCSNEQLKSISNLNALNVLSLNLNDQVSCFPEGMMDNMTSLATLEISKFRELKELPSDITKLTALSHLTISNCGKLEYLPEQGWEGLSSLRKLLIDNCKSLGSLPDGVRHLTSLEYLGIGDCPMLKERCKQGTGEDWHKIAHVPDLDIWIWKGCDQTRCKFSVGIFKLLV